MFSFSIAVLPALFFVTQPPQPSDQTTPPVSAPAPQPVVDAKAEALLADNAAAMFGLKSYAAQCDTVTTFPPVRNRLEGIRRSQKSTLVAVKPNLMRYDVWQAKQNGNDTPPSAAQEAPQQLVRSDGTRSVTQMGKTYNENRNVPLDQMPIDKEPWGGFYSRATSPSRLMAQYKQKNFLQELRYAGKETVEGVSCDVVTYQYTTHFSPGTQSYTGKLMLGPDKLLRRSVETSFVNGREVNTREATLRNIRTNFPAPPLSTFIYTPPPGVESFAKVEAARPKSLTAGTVAPDFTVEDSAGKAIKLSDFRGKTVVLAFWTLRPDTSTKIMPILNAADKKHKDSNVVVVAVNVQDDKAAVTTWISQNQATYDSIVFLIDPNTTREDLARSRYNVTRLPFQYVIDASGTIRTALALYDN